MGNRKEEENRVPEIKSNYTNDIKAGDMLFLHEMCNDVLSVSVSSGDVEGMNRFGKREDDKIRSMMVKFSTEELKKGS